MKYDIIISNGRVVDGTGNAWFKANIGLQNGKIITVGNVNTAKTDKIIDVRGMIVAPGILDLHDHSDTQLFINPKAESAVRQGITSVIVGNCGYSAAPLSYQSAKFAEPLLKRSGDLEVNWRSYKDYLKKLERQGTAINLGGLVGHGTLRMGVVGMEARHAVESEITEMKNLLSKSLKEGAFGLSTGLEYAPSGNASTEEIIKLAKVLIEYPGALYVTHMRQRDERALESVTEAIEIGEKSGAPVHISHHPPRYPFQGKMDKVLKLQEDARDRDLDVTFDVYISNYNMTSFSAQIPHWVHEGGREKLIERLKDPEIRQNIKDYDNPQVKLFRDGIWDQILLGNTTKHKEFKAKNIAEIAKIKGYDDHWDMLMDMMIEEGPTGRLSVYSNVKTDEDISKCLRHPTSMAVGSDVSALAPYGELGKIFPHPLVYGNYPMLFRKYVREMKVLTLEEAIRKVTSFPFQRLSVWDRGLLRPGYWADIMIFDKNLIKEKSTFKDPQQYPDGIEYVIVNGIIVIEKGKHTEELPGKILRARYL